MIGCHNKERVLCDSCVFDTCWDILNTRPVYKPLQINDPLYQRLNLSASKKKTLA
jgi:hypothetical protein